MLLKGISVGITIYLYRLNITACTRYACNVVVCLVRFLNFVVDFFAYHGAFYYHAWNLADRQESDKRYSVCPNTLALKDAL
jgi:hypothetical protein